jgi:hypothetical protein
MDMKRFLWLAVALLGCLPAFSGERRDDSVTIDERDLTDDELIARIDAVGDDDRIVSIVVFSKHLTPKSLERAARCRNLEGITLCGEGDVSTDEGIIALSGNVNLRFVHVHGQGISDIGLVALTFACRNLSDVFFCGATKITDEGVLGVASLDNLEQVELGASQAITDQGLFYLAQCKNLKAIYLREGGENVTDTGLMHLTACNSLDTLALGSKFITDASVIRLAETRNPDYLYLSSPHLTDQSVLAAAKSGALRYIELPNATEITDASLIALGLCQRLYMVNLGRAEQLTQGGIQQFRAQFPDANLVLPTAQGEPEAVDEWVF